MAAAGKSEQFPGGAGVERSVSDLESDLKQLREDIAKLTEQLAKAGQHSYGAARRAASEGLDHLKTQGEAAVEGLRDKSRDIEDQVAARVREKPITALAIAAGIGYFMALISRR
jgi:ElaB/YqjD/DUF883 family membrane-anchored ribosome-binding protein